MRDDEPTPSPPEQVIKLRRESATLRRDARYLRQRAAEASCQYEVLKKHFARLKERLSGLP
jgi:hypothetical protein